jgi:hypothetical protein
MNSYKWELYNLNDDPTQYNNLAAKMPKKLEEMKGSRDNAASE